MELCNISQIKELLERHGFHFSKAKGQNFLTQAWVPQRIAEEAGVDETCGVLEIGPGIGPLTQQLCLRAGDDLYLCTTGSGVVRYAGKTMEQKMVYPCGPSIVSASPYVTTGECQVQGTPILEDGKLIYTAADGYLYICNAETAECICKYHIGAPSFVSTVRAGQYLITADLNGRITAYTFENA